MIQRVITLVGELEEKLISIIDLPAPAGETSSGPGRLDEPVVPALKTFDVVSGQDEVDELLSSLGF